MYFENHVGWIVDKNEDNSQSDGSHYIYISILTHLWMIKQGMKKKQIFLC